MASFGSLVGYLVLFTFIAASFLLITLLVGKLVRPTLPNTEKDAIYECGEPTIGSSWVQFDLRFYVVALLFVIFDVEVAFFFPWATVFGKANQIAEYDEPISQILAQKQELTKGQPIDDLTTEKKKKLAELDERMAEVQKKPKQIMKELLPSGLSTKEKQDLGFITPTKIRPTTKGDGKDKGVPGGAGKQEGRSEIAGVEPNQKVDAKDKAVLVSD